MVENIVLWNDLKLLNCVPNHTKLKCCRVCHLIPFITSSLSKRWYLSHAIIWTSFFVWIQICVETHTFLSNNVENGSVRMAVLYQFWITILLLDWKLKDGMAETQTVTMVLSDSGLSVSLPVSKSKYGKKFVTRMKQM